MDEGIFMVNKIPHTIFLSDADLRGKRINSIKGIIPIIAVAHMN